MAFTGSDSLLSIRDTLWIEADMPDSILRKTPESDITFLISISRQSFAFSDLRGTTSSRNSPAEQVNLR
jgi:hypothetical protein